MDRNDTLFCAALLENKWSKAEALARDALQKEELVTLWTLRLALTQVQQGKNDEAIQTLTSLEPDDPQKWSALALLYAQFGEYPLAERCASRILRDPKTLIESAAELSAD